MTEKTVRCTTCSAEFSKEEISLAIACPACGSEGVPCDISQDTTININWHCLRILCNWAYNYAEILDEKYAESLDDRSLKTINSIIAKLETQRKEGWRALTLVGELNELADNLGIDYEVKMTPPQPKKFRVVGFDDNNIY